MKKYNSINIKLVNYFLRKSATIGLLNTIGGKSNSGEGGEDSNRFKKEKFAATRQAKLRLSNIKLEEITQIFRGKSKQIKH